MREIAFRAWDKKNKWMDDDFYLRSDGRPYDRASKTYDTPNLEIESTDDLVVMQFTGLHDKNGVKIFEGDIIESAGHFAQIRYSNIQCGFCAAELHDFNCYSVFPQPFLGRDKCQVIGSIHQNPELLEKKNE